jgi:hypothetical protein
VAEFLKRNYEGAPKTVTAIKKIMDGERNLETLRVELSRQSFLVILRMLQRLNGERIGDNRRKMEEDIQRLDPPAQQEQDVTLPQLLELVERAASGDQELGGQLFTSFQQMARDEKPAMSTLGNVLLRVLVGERNPNLDALPDEVASAIRGMLGRLKNK